MKLLPVIIVGSGDGHDDVHGINIVCSRRLILFLKICAEKALTPKHSEADGLWTEAPALRPYDDYVVESVRNWNENAFMDIQVLMHR